MIAIHHAEETCAIADVLQRLRPHVHRFTIDVVLAAENTSRFLVKPTSVLSVSVQSSALVPWLASGPPSVLVRFG